jgi:CheY-like chemotaxis protein
MGQREVLIVDDDRQVRDVLHQIFLGAGYKCLLANDGQEGVEVFRASIRDSRSPLTVTDLKMPIMGGIDLLQHVRQADPDAAVIVLTGAADVKTAIASLKLGARRLHHEAGERGRAAHRRRPRAERRQLLTEHRHYQELLERRLEEATRGLQLNRELQTPTGPRWVPGPSTRATWGPNPLAPCARLRWRGRRVPGTGADLRPSPRCAPRHRQDRHSRRNLAEARRSSRTSEDHGAIRRSASS